ncbi:hypothetical protein I203_102891 [Kwoniella mangroviensis CBS 8507]|uniref:uncharacterized protein n=1 Tax=Kwoniella mangroviensis CBS 8507 TaxID=1296122 RepID=UPI00080D808F|nr:uncharacterized protein I203_03864 [Kwoniella mangroviensis CBS 8507]OCF67178.1 hypothetical protein I203_03864 [Kwoniella mangroviensis CBS 8507]
MSTDSDPSSSSDERSDFETSQRDSEISVTFREKDSHDIIPYWELPPVSKSFKMTIENSTDLAGLDGKTRTKQKSMKHPHPPYEFDCTVNGLDGIGICEVNDESELYDEEIPNPTLQQIIDQAALAKVKMFSVNIQPTQCQWPQQSLRKGSTWGSLSVQLGDDGRFEGQGKEVYRDAQMTFIAGSAKVFPAYKNEESEINRTLVDIFKGQNVPLLFASTIKLSGRCWED